MQRLLLRQVFFRFERLVFWDLFRALARLDGL